MFQRLGRSVCSELLKQSQLFLVCLDFLKLYSIHKCIFLLFLCFTPIVLVTLHFSLLFHFLIYWLSISLRLKNYCWSSDSVCQEDGECDDSDHLCPGCVCSHWPAAVYGEPTSKVYTLAYFKQHYG